MYLSPPALEVALPKYDYICNKGHEFSVYQSIKDEPIKKCIESKCRAKAKRLISKTSFTLSDRDWETENS